MSPRRKLRFLMDLGVGSKVESWLREQGYDVKCVRELNPRAADRAILDMAVEEKRLVVTMDKDFGELVYNSKRPHSGVLLLRLDEANAAEKIAVLNRILESHQGQLSNRFSVYKGGRLRIR